MQRQKTLSILLLVYGVASLLHFIHNAEFLTAYPNLPVTWSRTDVYLAWAGMTLVGITGWWLIQRDYEISGLLIVMIYALCGLDSLGHYVLAPLSAHTMTMNVTILLEVAAAGLLLTKTGFVLRAKALPSNPGNG